MPLCVCGHGDERYVAECSRRYSWVADRSRHVVGFWGGGWSPRYLAVVVGTGLPRDAQELSARSARCRGGLLGSTLLVTRLTPTLAAVRGAYCRCAVAPSRRSLLLADR